MRRKGWILSSSLLILLIAVATAIAQDYQIRTRVDLVVVPVTVVTSGNRLVTGLNEKDFQIFENGQRQTLSTFSMDPVPLSAAVLLDSGLSASSFKKIQNTVPSLSGAFSDFDEFAIYRFDTHVTRLVDFTSDRAALDAGLNEIKDIKPQNPAVGGSPFSNVGPVINGRPIAPSIDAGPRTPAKESKVLHDALFMAAGDLAKRSPDRRRIVIVVSDGRAEGNEHSFDQTLERVQANNIQVYPIGMDVALLSRRFSVLNDYAKATGGDAFYLNSTDALEKSYTRAAEEARNQYVLGYFSTNKAPGPLPVFREITIRIAEGSYDVRHRKGYYQYP